MKIHRYLPRTSQGFTLIELMVAMTLTLFLAGGAILIHLSGRQASIDAERIGRMQENIRFASDYLVRDLRSAGFRDETFLRSGHENQIREAYATFIDGGGIADEIRIRFAGRGHCTEAFNTFRTVENYYYLDGDELKCIGSSVLRDEGGGITIPTKDKVTHATEAVTLISGVEGLRFQKICPDGTTSCACNLMDFPDASCIGAKMGLLLKGPQSVDGATASDDRAVEFTVAFRNVILDRVAHEPVPGE